MHANLKAKIRHMLKPPHSDQPLECTREQKNNPKQNAIPSRGNNGLLDASHFKNKVRQLHAV
jgi:hypothetical protein